MCAECVRNLCNNVSTKCIKKLCGNTVSGILGHLFADFWAVWGPALVARVAFQCGSRLQRHWQQFHLMKKAMKAMQPMKAMKRNKKNQDESMHARTSP